MFSGLILASLALATAPAALFGRKARAVWLEELDGIREDALDSPEVGVGSVADADEIWNESTDSAGHDASSASPVSAAPAQADPDEDHIAVPQKSSGPLWAEPAPHPVRPEEMWHPAATVPEPLDGEEDLEVVEAQPVATAAETTRESEPIGFDALFSPTRRTARRVALGDAPSFEDLEAERSPLPNPGLAPAAVRTPDRSGSLSVGADGVVADAGVRLRLGGDHQRVERTARGEVEVTLGASGDDGASNGWCWVTPEAASMVDVRVELPAALVIVRPGATALTVLEADGSAFVMVVDGEAMADRDGDVVAVGPSSVAMIDRDGGVEVDQAEPSEIEADPLVARNRELDAAS